jgi:hypothetical protein
MAFWKENKWDVLIIVSLLFFGIGFLSCSFAGAEGFIMSTEPVWTSTTECSFYGIHFTLIEPFVPKRSLVDIWKDKVVFQTVFGFLLTFSGIVYLIIWGIRIGRKKSKKKIQNKKCELNKALIFLTNIIIIVELFLWNLLR